MWDCSPEGALRVFLENMVGEALLAHEVGLDVTPSAAVDTVIHQVLRIARESFPLAQVLEGSDLVLHAEGPAVAAHARPKLSALNWLTGSAERCVRSLAANWFDIHNADGRLLVRKLDLRLTGFAPGSLWAGLRIEPPASDLLQPDSELIDDLATQLARLPEASRFIGTEGLERGIAEAFPDPAERDALLATLFRLSPTGKVGINSLGLSSRQSGQAELSRSERVILREALLRPRGGAERRGTFVGQVREADLDKSRIHLRGVEGIGTLRCVVPALGAVQGKAMLGETVRVSGVYQTDALGRPRLMIVEDVEPVWQSPRI